MNIGRIGKDEEEDRLGKREEEKRRV